MAPSRGKHAVGKSNDDETAVQQQGNTALINARRNFSYLMSPQSSTDRPARLRTRALIRTVRSIGQFIFWRLVRWAKYAAVAGVVAAISATALGTAVSGVAWIAAPPTIGASVFAACLWGVGKFAARRLHNRWKKTGGDQGEIEREDQHDHPLSREGTYGQELGPKAMPW